MVDFLLALVVEGGDFGEQPFRQAFGLWVHG
jgi:hypothetical protein